MLRVVRGRILVAMPDHWERVVLRAELIEHGYDVIGMESLADATECPAIDPERGPVLLILVGQSAMSGDCQAHLQALITRHTRAQLWLLTGAGPEASEFAWSRVLRRPVSIGEVTAEIDTGIAARANSRSQAAPLERH